MVKRMVIMLVLVIGLFAAFYGFKRAMIAKYSVRPPSPPVAVTATEATEQQWQPELTAVASLRAVRGVDVTTEIAGLVREIPIKSGHDVTQGALLVQLNADADVAQLNALEAAADLAKTVLTRDRAQFAAQAISQAQVDADEADLKGKLAQVAEQKANIAKKTIRAPFGGRLGINTVNPGQYLNPGDKIVTLQSMDPIFADFSFPQQNLSALAVGQSVTLTSDAYPGQTFAGKITAINPKVDTSTRNVQIEASIGNTKRLLLPGMFGNVSVTAGEAAKYLTLPQTAITYNPYGSTVFVAAPSSDKNAAGKTIYEAQQSFIEAGPTRGDQVAITKGIKAGQTVVTSGQIKLKNGSRLVIDNSVVPKDDVHPTPQEN
jgi:membrane fusion protein, multidrug efflux system